MRARRMPQKDEGFTLIELIMSIAILAILFSGITAAMIVTLSGITGRAQSVTDSSGAQILSAYLVADGQSADYVNPAQLPAGNANSFTCDDGTPTRVLLELRWTDADATTGTSDAVYKIEPTSATDYRLVRDLYTVPSASQTCSLVAETVVVPDVNNDSTFADAAYTGAVCDGGATCNSSSSLIGLQVAACVTDADVNTCDPTSSRYAPYIFDVYGTRRTS